ncbi:MAG: adenylate cyclase [Rhodothermales bacterium]
MSFFKELRRRNVFRVGIAYAITGWLIAQIAGLAADSFGAPDWVMKMIITILMLGFPIAMVMAWAYEMTPEGLRRDDGDEAGQSANTTKLDRTIIFALVAALAYFAYDKFVLDPGRDAAMLESAGLQTTEAEVAPQVEITKAQVQSIAVLPFVNMSKDEDNEYFADGLSEELLNILVKIPQLRVAARTSSFSFKNQDLTVSEIAEKLQVSHVLEGSVRKSGNQVRITAQLIKADDGFHLWSENFDRTLDDIFVMQDEIASKVAMALKVTLLGNSRAERGINPDAHIAYLKGLHYESLGGPENIERALPFLVQATELDPEYAQAWAILAIVYNHLISYGELEYREGMPLINQALELAKELDPNLALAWVIDGYIQKNLGWNWETAQQLTKKAIELEPNNSYVIEGRASVVGSVGRFEESVELYERAYSLDPLSMSLHSALGLLYCKVHRYDDAIKIFKSQAGLNPNYHWVHYNLAKSLLYKGEADQALLEIQKNADNFYKYAGLAMVYTSLGRESDAQAALERLVTMAGPKDKVFIAHVYAWRDQKDEAFEWLEEAISERYTGIAYMLGDNMFYSLLDDPRWAELLKKVKLYDYWLAMPAKYGGPQS